MSIGLLIGRFEPLHLGHLQDINIAAGRCNTLHIILTPSEHRHHTKLTLQDKARWVQVACEHFDFVRVHTSDSLELPVTGDYVQGGLPDEPMIQQVLAKVASDSADTDVIAFIKKDTDGQSALAINEYDKLDIGANPILYFDKLAPSAKSDHVQTVCIVGGESSGKTTLVHKLANHYGATVALEMGRLYTHSDLGGTEVGLQYSDYTAIAVNHARAILDAKKHATAPIVLVDTDFVTTQAFCEEYEGRTHPVVAALADEMRMDHTIYLDNNVKWVADGMRRLGNQKQRSRFATRLLTVLERHGISPYMIDDDDYHQRYLQAVRYIDQHVLKLTHGSAQ